MAKTEEQKEFDIDNQVDTHKNLLGKDKKLVKVDKDDERALKNAIQTIRNVNDRFSNTEFTEFRNDFENVAEWLRKVSKSVDMKIKKLNEDTAYRKISDNKDTGRTVQRIGSIANWFDELGNMQSVNNIESYDTAKKTVEDFIELSHGLKEKAAVYNYKILFVELGDSLGDLMDSLADELENGGKEKDASGKRIKDSK